MGIGNGDNVKISFKVTYENKGDTWYLSDHYPVSAKFMF